MDFTQLMSMIEDPSRKYRAVPFWSWNDRLDVDILQAQIQAMKEAGLGGYFMHARGGLQTEYLQQEWLDCIKAGIEKGKELGMDAWCYDENGWPSGFAGGAVAAQGPNNYLRWLELEEAAAFSDYSDENLVGTYCWNPGRGVIRLLQPGTPLQLDPGEKVLLIRERTNPYYVDILNPEVVKAFIENTHEIYYRYFKNEFGQSMPGFFTDEPQFKKGSIPWSTILEKAFYQKYHSDVKEILPALFLEVQDYPRARYQFWSLISELYVTSFGQQVYRWCEDHHCQLTGHVMQEDSLFFQMTATAGSMPFYEYMHIPGIDWLGRRIGDPITPKQVGSVAAQLGKKFVLSEMFALCGWNVSFEDLKWVAEWQYVNGINFMCQHLEAYSLRGLRKRDYPASLFIQQPWWEHYKAFNDYFARLGMLLAEGKSIAKVLLLHPMRSAWIAYNGENNSVIRKLDEDLIWTSNTLSGIHVDYHYGDETLLQKYAKVTLKGFMVGECTYQSLILPSMLSLDEKTLELLEQWMDGGGQVISAGDFPQLCNGMVDRRLQDLDKRIIHVGRDVQRLYSLLSERDLVAISISDSNGEIPAISYQQRSFGSTQIFFIVNHDSVKTYDAKVLIHGHGKLRRLVLETGFPETINFENSSAGIITQIQFLPKQSYVLILESEATEKSKLEERPRDEVTVVSPASQWNVDAIDLNALTLDVCSYRVDDGPWQNPLPVIKLMEELLALQRSCRVQMKFMFDVDMNLELNQTMFLGIEIPWSFAIEVNGNKVDYQDEGWWKDQAFKKITIKPWVRSGRNEIILTTQFFQNPKVYEVLFGKDVYETEKNKLTYDVELESIYVVGDFSVFSQTGYQSEARNSLYTEGPFVLRDQLQCLKTGDLLKQGLCFFSGTITLSQKFTTPIQKAGQRIFLQLNHPDAVLTKVLLNSHPVRTILWAPYTVDITEFVVRSENILTIQLFSGNRNLLGPHHHPDGELYNVGPDSFSGHWSWVDETFGTLPNNKENRSLYFWRNGYSFVKFGLSDQAM